MGLRFRKSIKIAPGIKLNLSKSGVGMSVGTKGARVSFNSKGRVTKTVGIPGTGISYVTTDNIRSTKKRAEENKTKSSANISQYANSVPVSGEIIDSSNNNNQSPKRSKRWFVYAMIAIVAVFINTRLFYPTIFIESLVHLMHIKKDLFNHPMRKKYTIITMGIIVISIFGTILTTFAAPSIESITVAAENHTMDIVQKQKIQLTYLPQNANKSKIDVKVSDDSLAEITILEDGTIELQTLSNEGGFFVQAESNDIKSNELSISIVDKEKLEAERIAAKKKAEDQQIAAEKKAEEDRIAAEKKAEEDRIAAEKKAEEKPITNANTQTDNSRTVYVTPTGKKYHYDNSCNGGSYSASTLDKAISMGLTPCNKCVN